MPLDTSQGRINIMSIIERIKTWARRIKRDAVTLWFAYRDPRTPWAVKVLFIFVVGYALSPIDLIPDFIPVLGYLDDAILLPGLIWLAVRLLPQEVLSDCRERAEARMQEQGKRPTSEVGAVIVVLIWVLVSYLAWRYWHARG